jgi:hypothetical protein
MKRHSMIISKNDLEVLCKKYRTNEEIVRMKCLQTQGDSPPVLEIVFYVLSYPQ